MTERRIWGSIIFGKVLLTAATVALAALGAFSGATKSQVWIISALAVYIILHSITNSLRDRGARRRLDEAFDRVQHRSVQVISDLGELAADRFDLWMIDLYLVDTNWELSASQPFIKRKVILSRRLTISLVDVRPQPASIEATSDPHWQVYEDRQPLLWFNRNIYDAGTENAWDGFDDPTNTRLASNYGALSIFPISDQYDRNCVGVLTVHVRPDRESIHKALGALSSNPGQRRLKQACVELNGLLLG